MRIEYRCMIEIIRLVSTLFQTDKQGRPPDSPKQFEIHLMNKKKARDLNEYWHSVLPKIDNWQNCECYGAFFENYYFAVAMWSIPSARALNGRGWFELRRMAIAPDAPRNTATRMLRLMRDDIKNRKPNINKLISYQDTDAHHGTIYKASNWKIGNIGERINENSKYNNWKTRPGKRNQSLAPKIRWELDIKRQQKIKTIAKKKIENETAQLSLI